MLKDVVEKLIEVGKNSVAPIIRDPDNNEAGYYLRTAEGHYEWVDSPPGVRDHTAHSVAAVCEFALAMVADGDCPYEPVLWYSENGVRLVIDDKNQRGMVQFPLTPHPHIHTLRRLELRNPLDQAGLIRLLRIDLAGTHNGSELLAAVRNIRVRQLAQGGGDVQHSKVSIGKTLEAEVTGIKPLPEEVTLSVTVFKELCYTQSVRCAVDIDVQQERFLLVPLPGQIDLAIQNATGRLGLDVAALIEDNVPVYHGVP